MKDLLQFVDIYQKVALAGAKAAYNNVHRWAAGIVNTAFKQVIGRDPTPAERQIVMAVSNLESNYGRGWKPGKGAGSHNWGAIQAINKKTPQFSHKDSSAKGSYVTGFKAYPDDIAGAADVIRQLFKVNNKQRTPDPNNANRATGAAINGPGRAELIAQAIQQGDTNAFSRAMWYTSYYEGTAPDFAERMRVHANVVQKNINEIASALHEPAAWNLQSPDTFLPVTSDSNIINKILTQTGKANPAPTTINNKQPNNIYPNKPEGNEAALNSLLWFN